MARLTCASCGADIMEELGSVLMTHKGDSPITNIYRHESCLVSGMLHLGFTKPEVARLVNSLRVANIEHETLRLPWKGDDQ